MALASGTTVGYMTLLRNNSRFRRLWAAQLISAAGDWFNSVAVLGLALQLTNSGLGASLVILCSSTPSFFLMPIAGSVADRLDRRTLMIISSLISAGIALLFLFVHGNETLWLLYVATVLLIMSASFFAPASSASIPNIVSPEELFSANALSGASWGVMLMVGSALGGIVSATFGRDVAFVINAISFLVAAIIIATIDIPSPKAEKEVHPWRDFIEGLHYLRDYLPAMGLVAVETGWGLAAGAFVLLTVFGSQVFKAGDAGIGFLYAARGLGNLVGPFVVGSIVGRDVEKLRRAIWLSFLLSGVGYTIFAASGWLNSLALCCLALFIAHFGGGCVWASSSVLLQLTTPDWLRGRVFSVNFGFATLTTGLSTVLYGLALQGNISPIALAVVAAVSFVIYGLFWNGITSQGRLHISEGTISREHRKSVI